MQDATMTGLCRFGTYQLSIERLEGETVITSGDDMGHHQPFKAKIQVFELHFWFGRIWLWPQSESSWELLVFVEYSLLSPVTKEYY